MILQKALYNQNSYQIDMLFNNIIIIIIVVILACLVFYLIQFLRTLTKALRDLFANLSVIAERFKREQEFIDGIIFRSKSAIDNFEETVETIERVVEVGRGVKRFWDKRKKDKEV